MLKSITASALISAMLLWIAFPKIYAYTMFHGGSSMQEWACYCSVRTGTPERLTYQRIRSRELEDAIKSGSKIVNAPPGGFCTNFRSSGIEDQGVESPLLFFISSTNFPCDWSGLIRPFLAWLTVSTLLLPLLLFLKTARSSSNRHDVNGAGSGLE